MRCQQAKIALSSDHKPPVGNRCASMFPTPSRMVVVGGTFPDCCPATPKLNMCHICKGNTTATRNLSLGTEMRFNHFGLIRMRSEYSVCKGMGKEGHRTQLPTLQQLDASALLHGPLIARGSQTVDHSVQCQIYQVCDAAG